MPGGSPGVVLKDLHTLFQVGTAGGLTDGQLIERFLSQRDDAGEVAFRALVERHAPMVLRICRDVVGDWHEAQDASQATFIVLACKAGSIRKRDSVASWLFGVACRIAAQAKAKASRRRRHEERRAELAAATIAQEDTQVPWLELYEEIDRLPERLRGPLVLCYLKGHSQQEAAARLGCPVRTLQNRLARAQERLRSRLTYRGLQPVTGLWVASTEPAGASAPIPVAWLEKTVQAAVASARHASTAGLVSTSVASLTEGMLRMMFRTRLKSIVAGVFAAAVITVGMGMLAILAAGAPPQDKRTAGAVKTAPRVAAGEIIVRAADISRDRREDGLSGMVAIDPETGNWRPIYKGLELAPGRVSPDGRYFVYSGMGVELPHIEFGIWVYDMTGKAPVRRIFNQKGEPFWTSNGRQVVIGSPVGNKYEKFETWRVNADGTGRTKLPIPDNDQVFDCSDDGMWLATQTISGEPRHRGRLTVVHPDGSGAHYLTEGSANDDLYSIFKISPESQSIAYVEIKTIDDNRHSRLFVADIDGKNRREIPIAFEPGITAGVSWSPDGSRLALNMINTTTKKGSIALVDRDGSNYRKLSLPPGRWNLHVCDWKVLTSE
jgi:RNA polymerase sigma factor (sigma-70 family)